MCAHRWQAPSACHHPPVPYDVPLALNLAATSRHDTWTAHQLAGAPFRHDAYAGYYNSAAQPHGVGCTITAFAVVKSKDHFSHHTI